METRIVTIDLDKRSYDIYIGAGLLYRMADLVPQNLEGRRIFVITDENVRAYAAAAAGVLQSAGASRVEMYVLKAGEQTKSFAQAEKVCQWLLQNGIERSSLVLAIGGGVVGDLAGFCASIILRGVPFVQVPTTLLAQVDSSVGGKTGINTKHGKNLVGSFYQPAAVIADIETLQSLPPRELLAGYAEIVKYGLIGDLSFFLWLESNGADVCKLDAEAVKYAVETSVRAKAAVVQADERETGGRRALLNLGHTFGHALEAAAGYDGRLLHGEAVAIGMVMAFDLSVRMGLCSREDYERVEKHLMDIGLPTRASMIDAPLKTTPDKLAKIMEKDKKSSGGKTKFILVSGIGQAFVSDDVSMDMVHDVLKDSLGTPAQAGRKGQWRSAFSSLSSS
ncbi:MAG: 3-dehydroquinate synthase [Alphaproteobacteria bacterium]|nr:3-dehydroquinate synthase [Alphaproteobacteria bacterium]